MPSYNATQANRQFSVSTPLEQDVLLFHRMSGNDQLGRLFQYDLELLSLDSEIKLQDVLGQNITVHCQRPDGEVRYFNGFVKEFSQSGMYGELTIYKAKLCPWFWLLTRTADCRIFLKKTVPEIIKEIFSDHGFSDYEDNLSGTYRHWENCVQYRETDFNFISRLMEQEGIYYYFEHEESKHTLVLSDSISAHGAIMGYEEVPYYPPGNDQRERDHISEWSLNQTIQPGVYALNDFDFEKPKANLQVKIATFPHESEYTNFEFYDYPGEYKENSEGENYVRVRIEELQVQQEQVQGQGNVVGLATGNLFELSNHPREDQNHEFLITAASYILGPQEYESTAVTESVFSCSFTAIRKEQAFRSARITPKPIVQGTQTAIVVGPSGEEIYTDKYGRVKVQFHWDRYSNWDENSSCWMRVSYPWAGKRWGAIAIPRIGHEVIVSFMEGDPDRPIITGCVYNDDMMPPYELPKNATQSGVKTRSSKKGTEENFNEIRFEDKKGAEELYIHAEYNQKNITENDLTVTVENNLIENITNNRTTIINKNYTKNVFGFYNIDIKGELHTVVNNHYTLKITGDAKQETNGEWNHWIQKNSSEWHYGLTHSYFAGAKSEIFVGAKSSTVLGFTNDNFLGAKVNIEGSLSVSMTKGKKWTISEAGERHKAEKFKAEIKKEYEIESKLSIKQKCEESSISINKKEIYMETYELKLCAATGDVTIKAKKCVYINSKAAFKVSAKEDVIIKSTSAKIKIG